MRANTSGRESLVLALVLWAALALLSSCMGGSDGTSTTSLDPPAEPEPPGELPAFPFIDHVDQRNIRSGRILFTELFTLGDVLFETAFTTLDGAGIARLPDGAALPSRFSRVPPGGGRLTGPNGQACVGCHNTPFPTSAGEIAGGVLQDPSGLGLPPFNSRSVISLFGSAVLQRLAEEMTEALHAIRDEAAARALPGGPPVTFDLEAKGVSFGRITAQRGSNDELTFDTSEVEGVDRDLVVRPYGWKGNVTTLRDFVRIAASNEMGMEADELVAKDGLARLDPDGDGVEGELSIGDITALTIYIGAQPTPTSRDTLAARGLEPPPTAEVARSRARGRALFDAIGCATCHVPELVLEDTRFEEPTRRGRGAYIDDEIDAGESALDPDAPFVFDLLIEGDPPRLEFRNGGGAIVRLFGDLKRHAMGAQLSDAQPTPVRAASGRALVLDGAPVSIAEAVFLTAELWGVGNTGPWLHDGRAASLEEAILLHGVDAPPPPGSPDRSEAQEARDAFAALTPSERTDVVEFLRSLVLVSFEED